MSDGLRAGGCGAQSRVDVIQTPDAEKLLGIIAGYVSGRGFSQAALLQK